MTRKEIFSILALIGLTVASFFSTVLTFISPLPIAYAFRRFNKAVAGIVVVASLVLVSLTFGFAYGIGFLLITVSMGVVLGSQLMGPEKRSVKVLVYRTMTYTFGIYIIIGIILLAAMDTGTYSSIMKDVGGQIDILYSNVSNEASVMGLSGKFYTGKEEIKEYFINNIFSFVAIAMIAMVVINSFFISGIFPDILDRKELLMWKVPSWYIWILLFSGFFMVLSFKGSAAVVAENIFRIILLPYFFQGIAVVAFYLNKKNYPSFLRIMIIVFMAMFFVIPSTLVGFIDYWLNFRKPTKTEDA